MPFDEYAGRDISVALGRAINRYNVSPADLRDLERVHGEDDAAMVDSIRRYSPKGSFSVYHFLGDNP